MTNSKVILNLAKVIVAAAWADGDISEDEINCLKDLLFNLKGITATDWAEIDMYIESPIDEAERDRLVAALEASLSAPEDKDLALQALDQLAQIDVNTDTPEDMVISEIKASIQDAHVGGMKRWSLFTRGKVQNRSQAAPNREQNLDDFIKNKIYYDVSQQMALENHPVQIPEADLRKLCLAGGLMARVAYADFQVTDVERQVIMEALQEYWQISLVEASVVVEMAASEISKGLDYYRLTRQFFEVTTEDQRVRFLDVLFAVAAGDGQASFEEIEEIRTIAIGFLLTHRQFIDAKLKLPAEKRVD